MITTHELKQIQLYRQHITDKTDILTVCSDLNGLQAQFMSNVYYALKSRCSDIPDARSFGDGLVKNWTVRGTVHVFSESDLPVFRHRDDYLSGDWRGYVHHVTKEWTLTPQRQKYFADFIVQKVKEGLSAREELRTACLEEGMTPAEHDSMFDQWGGGLRELCERGYLCYKAQEKKAFMLCPPFCPMDTEEALIEQMRRYLIHFAPATIKDISYYFGWTQSRVRQVMERLSTNELVISGKTYYYMNILKSDYPEIPRCIFLAGFDQLMLGYQKSESIYLPQQYLRGIYNLAGIVMPPILYNGNVAGRWRKKGNGIVLEMFGGMDGTDKNYILSYAEEYFPDIKKIQWTEI